MTTKQEILDNYISSFEDGPAQMSDEWQRVRQWSIGGSQIATFLGENPYSTAKEALLAKCDIEGTKIKLSNVYTAWGILFEEVIATVVEREFNINIKGTMLFIPAKKKGFHYSPDGLSISKDGKIILHEFKCPFARMPKNEIPDYYIPQLLVGMDIIPIVDEALFTQAVFRAAPYAKMGPANFTIFNTTVFQRGKWSRPPLYCGLITFECEDGAPHNDAIIELIEKSGATIGPGNHKDIGALDLNNFAPLVNTPGIVKKYRIITTDAANVKQQINKELMTITDPIYGFMSWKLYDIFHTPCARVNDYIESNKDILDPLVDIMHQCSRLDDKSAQEKIILDYFSSKTTGYVEMPDFL